MPQITLYPSSVIAGNSFSTGELGKIVTNAGGSSQGYARDFGDIAWGSTPSGTFTFPMANIPNGSVVNSLTAYVFASAELNAARAFDSVAITSGSPLSATSVVDLSPSIGGQLISVGWNNAQLTTAGYTTSALRNNALQWTGKFRMTDAAACYTYWRNFYLVVDYTPGSTPFNSLFFGTDF